MSVQTATDSVGVWPVRKAIVLTLFLVLLPYAGAVAVALVNPWAIAGIPALAASTPWTFPVYQRLVRFMLTGDVDAEPVRPSSARPHGPAGSPRR